MSADKILSIVGQIAGVGGIALGIFFLILRQIIEKLDWPKPTKDQAFKLLRTMVLSSFALAVIGLAAWLISLIIEGGFKQAKQTVDAGGRATLTFNIGSSSVSAFDFSPPPADEGALILKQPSDDEVKYLIYRHLTLSGPLHLRDLAISVIADIGRPYKSMRHEVTPENVNYAEVYICAIAMYYQPMKFIWRKPFRGASCKGNYTVAADIDGSKIREFKDEKILKLIMKRNAMISLESDEVSFEIRPPTPEPKIAAIILEDMKEDRPMPLPRLIEQIEKRAKDHLIFTAREELEILSKIGITNYTKFETQKYEIFIGKTTKDNEYFYLKRIDDQSDDYGATKPNTRPPSAPSPAARRATPS